MALIANKREFLARGLRGLGIVRLLEHLARRPGLLVLTYHRIGDPSASPYYAPVASATPDALEAELVTLRRTHRVIGVEEAADLADRGFPTKEPLALVTFDDGYRDNFEAALPVLISQSIPAAFFLPTAFISTPRLPWWDHIAYVINTTSVPLLRLDWPRALDVDLERIPRRDAIALIVQMYLAHHVSDEPRFREALEARAGVEVDEEILGRSLFMSWDEARSLTAAGMSIGSHGHSHRALSGLSEDEQRADLVESKRILQHELGRDVIALAYPYGWPGTYNDITTNLAQEAGYRLAFASVEGINRPGAANPHALRRLGVGYADAPLVHRARWALMEAFGKSLV